jgi:hypothetical protein
MLNSSKAFFKTTLLGETKKIWVHFISVGGSPKKREGWGMYIPHPSLFFGWFNSFETHPKDFTISAQPPLSDRGKAVKQHKNFT